MSHKLVKKQQENDLRKIRRRKQIYKSCFLILAICFVMVWSQVALTAFRHKEQLNHMVLGENYFIDDVMIINKKMDSYSSSEFSNTENYYLYYGHDATDKLLVPHDVYVQYQIGDTIPAYTLNHIDYKYTPEQLLPDYTGNELLKATGCVIGCVLALLGILYWIDARHNSTPQKEV